MTRSVRHTHLANLYVMISRGNCGAVLASSHSQTTIRGSPLHSMKQTSAFCIPMFVPC